MAVPEDCHNRTSSATRYRVRLVGAQGVVLLSHPKKAVYWGCHNDPFSSRGGLAESPGKDGWRFLRTATIVPAQLHGTYREVVLLSHLAKGGLLGLSK